MMGFGTSSRGLAAFGSSPSLLGSLAAIIVLGYTGTTETPNAYSDLGI